MGLAVTGIEHERPLELLPGLVEASRVPEDEALVEHRGGVVAAPAAGESRRRGAGLGRVVEPPLRVVDLGEADVGLGVVRLQGQRRPEGRLRVVVGPQPALHDAQVALALGALRRRLERRLEEPDRGRQIAPADGGQPLLEGIGGRGLGVQRCAFLLRHALPVHLLEGPQRQVVLERLARAEVDGGAVDADAFLDRGEGVGAAYEPHLQELALGVRRDLVASGEAALVHQRDGDALHRLAAGVGDDPEHAGVVLRRGRRRRRAGDRDRDDRDERPEQSACCEHGLFPLDFDVASTRATDAGPPDRHAANIDYSGRLKPILPVRSPDRPGRETRVSGRWPARPTGRTVSPSRRHGAARRRHPC